MGNCLVHKKQSSNDDGYWDDDYWRLTDDQEQIYMRSGSVKKVGSQKIGGREEEEGLLVDQKPRASTTEVKIKITKKQLEELLGRAHMENMSMEVVLTQLIKAQYEEIQLRHRIWRPSLKSIPEVN